MYESQPTPTPGGLRAGVAPPSSQKEAWQDMLSRVSFFRQARAIATGDVPSENKDAWIRAYREMLKDEDLMLHVKEMEGTKIPLNPWGGRPMMPPAWS